MNNLILETKDLTKKYGQVTAVDHVNLKLCQNKIYGLLGRNGAGKTTFLNLITSRIFAESGEASLFGKPVTENAETLEKICYMPEKNLFLNRVKVRDTLRGAEIFFKNYDPAYARALCEKFELNPDKKYNELSRGYESILRIVIGLASRSELTIFDEPVLGLDAAVRDIFYRELIEDFTEHPRTIIISTHLIEESADIFDEAVIIQKGKLIEQAPVEALKERAHYISGKSDLVDRAAAGLNRIHTEEIAGVKICAVYQEIDSRKALEITQAGLELSPIPVQKLFIYLTDHNGREAKS
ncbi:MAG TPA: ABC transporter ATP-binding protein [Clostridia bacterium]|nr:ABC transporter ATP-binding protein [Clostridia bacterium]